MKTEMLRQEVHQGWNLFLCFRLYVKYVSKFYQLTFFLFLKVRDLNYQTLNYFAIGFRNTVCVIIT